MLAYDDGDDNDDDDDEGQPAIFGPQVYLQRVHLSNLCCMTIYGNNDNRRIYINWNMVSLEDMRGEGDVGWKTFDEEDVWAQSGRALMGKVGGGAMYKFWEESQQVMCV